MYLAFDALTDYNNYLSVFVLFCHTTFLRNWVRFKISSQSTLELFTSLFYPARSSKCYIEEKLEAGRKYRNNREKLRNVKCNTHSVAVVWPWCQNNAGSVRIDYLFAAQERFRRILNLAYSVVVILLLEGEEIRMQTWTCAPALLLTTDNRAYGLEHWIDRF